jgi:hypothetical protein
MTDMAMVIAFADALLAAVLLWRVPPWPGCLPPGCCASRSNE